jgi:hypothetical protein
MTPTHDETARSWREQVVTPYQWELANDDPIDDLNASRGVSAGHVVAHGELRAFAKPARIRSGRHHGFAACEKIASDLAHELGVRVPPAALVHGAGAAISGGVVDPCAALSALSLVCFPEHIELRWALRVAKEPKLDPRVADVVTGRTTATDACGRGVGVRHVAFDTWVGKDTGHTSDTCVLRVSRQQRLPRLPRLRSGFWVDR